MEDADLARAPLRARILASINPYAASSSTGSDPIRHDGDDGGDGGHGGHGHGDRDEPTTRRHRHHHHHRHHRHHHHHRSTSSKPRANPTPYRSRSQSRSRSRSRSPRSHDHKRRRRHDGTRSQRRKHHSTADEEEPEDPFASPPLDPDAAFRQSLFDAMADDEGAAYWEAVYGQPVHEYAREAGAGAGAGATARADDATGIDAMDDEAYAAYVRQRMWERSDAGRREARAAEKRRRDAEARQQQDADAARARAEAEHRRWAAAVERSLRRGAARRRRRQTWQARWDAYTAAWARWEAAPSADTIPWPGGGREEGNTEETEKTDEPPDSAAAAAAASSPALINDARDLFTGGPDDRPPGAATLRSRLRDERVRWHPDKMQQRLGGSVDAAAMRDITAIFQVVDKLWGELKV